MSAPTSRLGLWLVAARPRTLAISLAPILAASAQAFARAGRVEPVPVLAALLAALAIQIATNLFNDAADGARGHDGPARLGPPRVTALGLIPAQTVTRAAWGCVALAMASGAVAALYGGWPILLIGAASLVAGWAYSNGPAPISASPFGEAFVVIFFGVAAVCGVVFLAAPQALDASTFLLGLAMGLPAAATLTVNNHRDRVEDARNGRRTLAILIGPEGAARLYGGLLLAAAALLAALAGVEAGAGAGALVALALIPAFALARRLRATPIGPGLNALIARTAGFELLLAALYAAAVLFVRT